MPKLRVYQLAKELQVQSALIIELLDRMGRDIRSDLSVLDEDTAVLVRQRITAAINAAKKRLAEEQSIAAAEAAALETGDDVTPVDEPAPTPAPTSEPDEVPPVEEPEVATPIAADEPATPADAEIPTEEPLPVAAKPAEPVVQPAKAPAARPAAAKPAARPTSPAPTTPAAARPLLPGQRKPRVFPARRAVPITTLRKPIPPRPAVPAAGRPATPYRPAPPGARPFTPAGRPGPGGRPGAGRPRRKKDRERHVAPAIAKPKDLPPVPANVTLSEAVTVKELAEKLNRKSKDVIAKLIAKGVLATINQPLDPEVAQAVAKEFGSEAKIITFEEEAQQDMPDKTGGEEVLDDVEVDRADQLTERPPVVTVMGHVDHGKTSLLDAIRATDVASREAGGITQHIGAYQVMHGDRAITFLDTPGHEAFTMMRARGSRVTDIVVLMVAADDGVKPQTIEAIDHAKAAGVPMIVAINKIDKSNAEPERVKQQLAQHDVMIEEYGGDTVACEISAKQRVGIDALLEMILLVADLREYRANPNRKATGVVLEAKLDRAQGIISTVLVQNGTLRVGDPFIAGATSGKVRAMTDERGQRLKVAGPSSPVEVTGFSDGPDAGDSFQAVADESKARHISAIRKEKIRAASHASSARRSLESLSREMAAGEVRELAIILRCDVQGSGEALQKGLSELPTDKIRINVIRSSIGAITRADVLLATASNAIIVGFNVRADRDTNELAKQEGVEIRLYAVIYDMLNDIKQAMIGMLAPTEKEVILGQAEVRQTFKVPKLGIIAGCYVTDGKVARNAEVRLLRENVVIYTGKVGSLRRFKDDASEVKQGYECGIGIAGYNDLKEGDLIEFFVVEKIAAETL